MPRLVVLFLLLTTCTQAQKKPASKRIIPSPVGGYSMRKEHDPQGDPALFVLENNRYVIMYFGGAQVGTWKQVRDSFVVFTPYIAATPYQLYGRHSPALKDSLRIYFSGFDYDRCFVALNVTEAGEPVLQQVAYPSPGCITYLNAGEATTLSFAHEPHREYGEAATKSGLYTFSNGAQYNDFIAYHYPVKSSDRPFFALWSKQQLYFNHFPEEYFKPAYKDRLTALLEGKAKFYYDKDNGNRRGPLPDKGEDAALIRGLGAEIVIPDTVFYNPFYNEFPMNADILQQEYTYQPEKAAYLGKGYMEGEEYGDSYKMYNSDNVIYVFRRLPTATIKATDFKVNEKRLFYFRCKEGKSKPASK